jgi:hypothetical protein
LFGGYRSSDDGVLALNPGNGFAFTHAKHYRQIIVVCGDLQLKSLAHCIIMVA